MKHFYLTVFLSILFLSNSYAKYTSPGTGVNWSIDDLVANSAGKVTLTSGEYFINDTIIISTNDRLFINTDVTVKFAYNTYLLINGTIVIDPPTGVKFTAQDIAAGYLGIWLNMSTGSVFKKLTFEYAVSFKFSDCNAIIDNCVFQYNNNNASTSFGNGAIALFRASPVITNSRFLNNKKAAIQGGANIDNAPQIIGNYFEGNNTTNANVPQINLGATGIDTCRILNNQILRSSIMSGGIGFLPLGDVHVLISGNVIKNNRYGINLQGGSNINAIVSYNRIDSNNTQGNANLGGSGISFSGGSASSHQTTIVTGNIFTANLWGITIQGGCTPNLGNLSNADTTDDGKNRFINNTNSTTPGVDLYNNTVNPIFAQNNYWNTNDINEIESKIFHYTDNNGLGLVDYSFSILPIELSRFTANIYRNNVLLNWQTEAENNSSWFEVQRSVDGQNFITIGKVQAAGNSSSKKFYDFEDNSISGLNGYVFYRLKLIDKDGSFKNSTTLKVSLQSTVAKLSVTKVYPTVINNAKDIFAIIESDKVREISIQVLSADGKLLIQKKKIIQLGINSVSFYADETLPKGILFIKFVSDGFSETKTVLKQ